MTSLVPIMLFGWVPLTIICFIIFKPHHAVLVSVIGGVLFLPMAIYNIPGAPAYSKNTAIALGLILGGRFSGQRQAAAFELKLYDVPMIVFCLCPIATSLSNQLGLYDGLAASFSQTIVWGIPYLTGRVYFNNAETLRDLCLGIVVGGLLYVPLCLFEVRMSPQLSNILYGFFPHSFSQHVRYGGFRPIVFMQHALMVSFWMAVSSTVSFWLWRSKEIKHIKGISMSIIVAAQTITTVLCKTVAGWFVLVIGCGSFFLYRKGKSTFIFQLLLIGIPLYIVLRLTGIVAGQDLVEIASNLVESDRVSSLEYRFDAEDKFSRRAFERPLLGWGGYGRSWPIDPETGGKIRKSIDSFWLIFFSTNGSLGLISFVTAILVGPWLIFFKLKEVGWDIMVIALIVVLFMVDSLMNGMFNPVYVLATGALIGYYVNEYNKTQQVVIPQNEQ